MLSDHEYVDKHKDALGHAHRACQYLARNADPDYINARGMHYERLKKALLELDGSARQIGTLRSDARWIKLSILYGGRIKRAAQQKYVGQAWKWFGELMPLFENGLRQMDELATRRTGRLSSEPILPQNPSSWITLPDLVIPQPPGLVHGRLLN